MESFDLPMTSSVSHALSQENHLRGGTECPSTDDQTAQVHAGGNRFMQFVPSIPAYLVLPGLDVGIYELPDELASG